MLYFKTKYHFELKRIFQNLKDISDIFNPLRLTLSKGKKHISWFYTIVKVEYEHKALIYTNICTYTLNVISKDLCHLSYKIKI